MARTHPSVARALARERLQERRSCRAASGQALTNLDHAVTCLGLTTDGLPHTRTGLAAWYSVPGHRGVRTLAAGAFAGLLTAALLTQWLFPLEIDALRPVVSAEFADQALLALEYQSVSDLLQHPGAPLAPVVTALVIMLATLVALLTALGYPLVAQFRRRRPDFPYALLGNTARALSLCAVLYHSAPADRHRTMRELDSRSRRIEENVLSAYRDSRLIPRRSHRIAPARQHGRHVAAALRQQLARIDVDPRQGAHDYAAMVAEIGERYAQGKVGGLLPEEQLAHVTPPSPALTAVRETLHIAGGIAAAVMAAIATAALLPRLGFIPEDLRPWLVAGVAAVAGILTAGWHRVARLVPLFGP
ncbi:hypothetical protein EAO71_24375 [Streptomyces sp. ms191]|uniref:hypothetical protein n=1 Tax=Streptomyces sp. ms191 TaxID=1827978 RepID=UPI0011CDA432|nr:hypothetical protein [Streptomyces sp. ms191]TXS22638.1 hypothetical protein EAO71_24375 [Streptomyces sp. ms191]